MIESGCGFDPMQTRINISNANKIKLHPVQGLRSIESISFSEMEGNFPDQEVILNENMMKN